MSSIFTGRAVPDNGHQAGDQGDLAFGYMWRAN